MSDRLRDIFACHILLLPRYIGTRTRRSVDMLEFLHHNPYHLMQLLGLYPGTYWNSRSSESLAATTTMHVESTRRPQSPAFMGCGALRAVSKSPSSVAQRVHGQRDSLLPVTLFQICTMSDTMSDIYQNELYNPNHTINSSTEPRTSMANQRGLLSPQSVTYI